MSDNIGHSSPQRRRDLKHTHLNFHIPKINPVATGTYSHPHLLFDIKDIEAVRSRIESGRPKALWNRLEKNCRLYLDPESDYFVDYENRKGDFGTTRLGYYTTLRSAADLAFAGLVRDSEEYSRRAAHILFTLCSPGVREDTFIAKSVGRDWGMDDIWFAHRGEYGFLQGLTYDMTAPFMEDKEKEVVQALFLDRLEFAWSMRWERPLGTDNRPMTVNLNPAYLSISLWGDSNHPVLYDYPAFAEPNAEDYLDNMFYSDGVPVEGFHYGTCIKYPIHLGIMLSRKGIENGILDHRPLFKNIVHYYYLAREPGNRGFAAAKVMDRESPCQDHSFWLNIASLYDVPLARWWWRRCFDFLSPNRNMARFQPNAWYPGEVLNLLVCDDNDEEMSPQEANLPSSYHFKRRGLVVARRDHEEDTPVFRLMAGRRAPGTVVQHWDAMSISLSGFGQRFIVDPGFYYANPGGAPIPGAMSDSQNHSSILIDGKGQESLSEKKIWPAFIQWHEQKDNVEYTLASALAPSPNGYDAGWCDGYGAMKTAERHALVVHEGETPFYTVICDMFDYPETDTNQKKDLPRELQFVLITGEDTSIEADDHGANIIGPKASMRVELVTTLGVRVEQDRLGDNNPRIIWSRKGKEGRFLFVLTPLKDGQKPPVVSMKYDDRSQTGCEIQFAGCTDQFTCMAPRPLRITDGTYRIQSGMRMKWLRSIQGQTRLFTIPTMPDPYVFEPDSGKQPGTF